MRILLTNIAVSLFAMLFWSWVVIGQTAPCSCPKFQVASNLATVKAGEMVEFQIVPRIPSISERKFSWTLSAGTIVSGQGTDKISVQTTPDMLTPKATPPPSPGQNGYIMSWGFPRRGMSLTAAVEFADVDCSCPGASETIWVGDRTVEVSKFANVTDLQLSETQLIICRPGVRPREGASVVDLVDVKTTAFDPENDVLTYEYVISGGTIIGKGANVKWDLKGAAPGTYTITAAVDDGCGLCGKTLSKTVTVEDCTPTCSFTECPELSISSPSSANLNWEYYFTANVSGGSYSITSYTWTVTNVEIVEGQGTPSIKVRAPLDPNEPEPTITLKVVGDRKDTGCRDSETFTIPKKWYNP